MFHRVRIYFCKTRTRFANFATVLYSIPFVRYSWSCSYSLHFSQWTIHKGHLKYSVIKCISNNENLNLPGDNWFIFFFTLVYINLTLNDSDNNPNTTQLVKLFVFPISVSFKWNCDFWLQINFIKNSFVVEHTKIDPPCSDYIIHRLISHQHGYNLKFIIIFLGRLSNGAAIVQ